MIDIVLPNLTKLPILVPASKPTIVTPKNKELYSDGSNTDIVEVIKVYWQSNKFYFA